MIRVQDLCFAYEGGSRDAVKEVSFGLQSGGLYLVAGANGSGKSSMLLLLSGIFLPRKGSIVLGNIVVPGQEKELRRRTGLLLQEAELQILGNTVGEDLLLGADPADGESGRRARRLAERLGLLPLWDTAVDNLSGGEKRKLCLAAILMADPQVILYDEPFSGLDYPAVRELRQIMQDNADRGATQLVATHDLEPAVDLARELLLMDQGELIDKGSPAHTLDRVADHGVRPPCLWQREGRLLQGLW